MKSDFDYIQLCFELAKKALGNTSPNPFVGSVIVKNDKIIGSGYHTRSGQPHAEIEALNNCSEDPLGATLYCNLEPCCHTNKKTPPCVDSIIKAGIKKVVISNLDVNPEVAGRGVQILRDANIEVIHGVSKEKGEILNEVFFTHITKKRPFIHLKWAQTLDGKMATLSNQSKWITGELAREYVHKERSLYDAIMIGGVTANADNPSLTIRDKNGEQSKRRIILSPNGELSKDLKLLNDEYKAKTLLVSNSKTDFNIEKISCELNDGKVNLEKLLEDLYKKNIFSVYIEGGPKLINSFIEKNLFDRVSIYIAPKLLGEGKESYTHTLTKNLEDALNFKNPKWTILNQDILMESTRNICLQD